VDHNRGKGERTELSKFVSWKSMGKRKGPPLRKKISQDPPLRCAQSSERENEEKFKIVVTNRAKRADE